MDVPTHAGWEVAGIKGIEGLDGAVWFRTSFELPKHLSGKDLILDLGKIRDQDFTYFNGELIGSTEGSNESRKYIIPAAKFKKGKNYIAVQVLNYYDKGGLVGYKDPSTPLAFYPVGGSHKEGLALDKSWKYLVQDENAPPVAHFQADYQPFADLLLNFENHENATDYRRELDLSTAIASTTYTVNGVKFTREYFVSEPQQLLVIRIKANKARSINMESAFYTPHSSSEIRKIDKNTLGLSVLVKNGALFGDSRMRVYSKNGDKQVLSDKVKIRNADEVTIYVSAATNFISFNNVSGSPSLKSENDIKPLANNQYEKIKKRHIKDYQSDFNTFSIGFGGKNRNDLPTDERIENFAKGDDPEMLALYAQYGRYLLISSSRPGTQPANLQGIWNELMTPPWGSKYTTNINVEMNYWPAEIMGLSALHEPLFGMVDELRERGKETAKIHYDSPGWVVHHNTDLWRGTAPINNSNHGVWLGAPAWFSYHFWERFLFTLDKKFLQDRAYPVMKDAALFYKANLVKDLETGYLISSPSNSPEQGGLVAGPAMDHQLIRSLFANCIEAAQLLNIDQEFVNELKGVYSQIAPDQIGKHGQLMEWVEDLDDPDNKHRHVSHLWAVYPGNEINWEDSPELMDAAIKSLNFRGDEGTGWSLAWKINLWARIKDAERTNKLLNMLISPSEQGGGSYPNLLDAHPPFQIDGNFGGAAGISEMLVQSHTDFIDLLPTLPSNLTEGKLAGIRARGGFILDIEWQNSTLKKVIIQSPIGGNTKIRFNNKSINLKTKPGETYQFNGQLQSTYN
jgi:alpha-L-fucosidase 2